MSWERIRTPELEAAILERVANGESLRAVCAGDGMPGESQVRYWASSDPAGFGARLRQARETSASYWDEQAERVLIEAEGTRDEITRAKELSQLFRWRASKYAPQAYGDRLEMNVNGTIAIAEQLAEVRQRRAMIEGTAEPIPLALAPPVQPEEVR